MGDLMTLDQAVQLGAAGAVLLVVGMFLRYLTRRDKAVQSTLEDLRVTVAGLHGFLRSNGVRRCPVAEREQRQRADYLLDELDTEPPGG